MAAAKGPKVEEIYQIKITLMDTKPPIWRRLLVPSDMTLAKFHFAIQIAMGWTESHLHEFEIDRERYGMPDPEAEGVIDERKVKLSSVLGEVKAKARYNYDFGDDWRHELVVEKVIAPEPGVRYPVCTAGKLACPPEDCGGVWGYYQLLKVLGDPGHEDHESMREWAGEIDPETFSLDLVNDELEYVRKRRKPNAQSSAGR